MARTPLTKPIRHHLEAALAYSMYGLFRVLPVDLASNMGGNIARLFGPLSRAHRTGSRNLTRAMPDLTEPQRREILNQVWDNLGRVMAEYGVLSRLWRKGRDTRVEICGEAHIKALAAAKKPALIFSGHIANWEVTALTVGWTTTPPALVYRAPNNPLIEGLLNKVRGDATSSLIPKGAGGARSIMRTLREGGFVMMAVDQKMNTGLPIPFFERDAMTGDAIGRLAQRYNCAIVPMVTERLEGCRFRVTFEEPWHLDESTESEKDIETVLRRINKTLERWIRARPGQWLWLHNRWPQDEHELKDEAQE